MIFGPFSRFRLEETNFAGKLSGYELWDAEMPDRKGLATLCRKFVYASDAFQYASTLVHSDYKEATANGPLTFKE